MPTAPVERWASSCVEPWGRAPDASRWCRAPECGRPRGPRDRPHSRGCQLLPMPVPRVTLLPNKSTASFPLTDVVPPSLPIAMADGAPRRRTDRPRTRPLLRRPSSSSLSRFTFRSVPLWNVLINPLRKRRFSAYHSNGFDPAPVGGAPSPVKGVVGRTGGGHAAPRTGPLRRGLPGPPRVACHSASSRS